MNIRGWMVLVAMAAACKGGDQAGSTTGSAAPAPATPPATAPAPAAAPTPTPAAPAAPAAPTEFTDEPLGEGSCRFVSVKEMSEVLKTQMKYMVNFPEIIKPCRLRQAAPGDGPEVSFDGAGGGSTKVTEDEPQAGVAEKAGWSAGSLFFVVKGNVYRVSVTDARTNPMKPETIEAANLIAKRIAAN